MSIEDDYSGELPRAYVVLTEAAQKRVKDDDAAAKKVKDSIYDFVKEHKSKAKWLDGGVECVGSSLLRKVWPSVLSDSQTLSRRTRLVPCLPSSWRTLTIRTGKLLRRVLRDKARAEKVKPKL